MCEPASNMRRQHREKTQQVIREVQLHKLGQAMQGNVEAAQPRATQA
jgi:hypothetical protein